MMDNTYKKPTDLTEQEIEKAAHNLMTYYDFSVYADRNVSLELALTLALEYAASDLGLVNNGLYEQRDYDSQVMMTELVARIHQFGKEHIHNWHLITAELPYLEE
ncbi:hypothetical protein [Vibrio mediterranei]|uniref:hypothetical protein n=1 Tax=Vibrio mediterranei TaxID=689 RepID=UPI00406972C6